MITNLKDSPSLINKTLQLIEESFEYQSPYNFLTEFAPLLAQDNLQNCFVLQSEDEEVIAHIGTKERQLHIGEHSFKIVMLGGIAVAKNQRGSGIFQKLFSKVISDKKNETTFFILWSDLEKLYNKFGFYLCGGQFDNTLPSKTPSTFLKTKLNQLGPSERDQIKSLYEKSFAKNYLTLKREDKDWEDIQKISSADLFIRSKNNQISDYFLMNKGQDLSGIIYEYATNSELTPFLTEISAYGTLWTGENFLSSENAQYQFFLSIGNEELFSKFIDAYTESKFQVRAINFEKNEIFIDFEEETLSFEIEDFLRGVFGPESFEELQNRPIFISGIDSI